jgi:hypothetical protein
MLAAALLALAAAFPAPAAKKLASHVDLQAFVSDNLRCAERIAVRVVAPSRDRFQGDRLQLQRLTGAVRAALGFQCDGVEDIVLTGQVEGRTVWRGVLSGKNGWVLVDLPVPGSQAEQAPAPAPKMPSGSARVAAAEGAGGTSAPGRDDLDLRATGSGGAVPFGKAPEDAALGNTFP